MAGLVIQMRRLGELLDPRTVPLKRAAKNSSLICLTSSPIIEADYTKRVEEIYLEVATQVLQIYKNLELQNVPFHYLRESGPGQF